MTSRPNRPVPEGEEVGSASGEHFLRRWSRRKSRARRRPAENAGGSDAGGEAAGEQGPERTARAAPPETRDSGSAAHAGAGLPALEALGEDSDYSAFLSPEVDQRLRRLALRKLFLSSKFNITDGLDDYDEDYRTFEALGDIITSDMRFDMKRKAERAERERLARAESATAQEGTSAEGSTEIPAAQTEAGDAAAEQGSEAADPNSQPQPLDSQSGDPEDRERGGDRQGGDGDERSAT